MKTGGESPESVLYEIKIIYIYHYYYHRLLFIIFYILLNYLKEIIHNMSLTRKQQMI